MVFRITKALDAHLLRAHRLTERCRVWGARNSDSVSVLFELGLVMIVTLAEATHSLTLPERMRGFGLTVTKKYQFSQTDTNTLATEA